MASKKGNITQINKEAFKEAMMATFGNVTAATKKIGIDRSTPYQWCRDDKEFEAWFNSNEWEECFLDMLEQKMKKLALTDENPTMLIFLAKTKGKRRGYIEKQEIDHSIKEMPALPSINLIVNGDNPPT